MRRQTYPKIENVPNDETYVPNDQTGVPNFETNVPNNESNEPNEETNVPNEETKVEARMIWKVRLFREEKSKKGSLSS